MNDDTISRQAAIDAILHNQEVYSNNFSDDPIDKYTIAIIENDAQTIVLLPSAERLGRWEQVGDNAYRCSVCGEISCCNSPFCSECGAKMEGEEE